MTNPKLAMNDEILFSKKQKSMQLPESNVSIGSTKAEVLFWNKDCKCSVVEVHSSNVSSFRLKQTSSRSRFTNLNFELQ